MPENAINLIALVVGAMTLSTLVGPAVGLSPGITVAATALLLVGYSLDSFVWRSQGLALTLDWVDQRSPDHRQRILHHEAGHLLVATLLDLEVTGYALSAWEAFRQGEGVQIGVRFRDARLEAGLASGQLPVETVNRYCQALMAGGAAEQLIYGNVEGGQEDVAQFRQLWRALGRSEEDCQRQQRLSAILARELIAAHRDCYDQLVEAMAERQSAQACRALVAPQSAASAQV